MSAIGNFFKSVFKAVGRVFKAIINSQIARAIIQVAACAFMGPACAAVTVGLTLASGGSIAEAMQAGVWTFISAGVWTAVGQVLTPIIQGLELVGQIGIKSVVHGVVGGALSVAQGGTFQDGFVANAIGAGAGLLAGAGGFGKLGSPDGLLARTAIAAGAGGAAAELTGGKFANGAITAGMAHLFNAEEFAKKMSSPSRDIPVGADVDENIRAAEVAGNFSPRTGGQGFFWFYNQVRNGGPWDYKRTSSWYEDFGNFNYGATGSAFGYSEATLLRAAGWAQSRAGTSSINWGKPTSAVGAFFGSGGSPPFGDDPKDQYWIKEGIKHYNEYKASRG